jgi:hypothetical protein
MTGLERQGVRSAHARGAIKRRLCLLRAPLRSLGVSASDRMKNPAAPWDQALTRSISIRLQPVPKQPLLSRAHPNEPMLMRAF